MGRRTQQRSPYAGSNDSHSKRPNEHREQETAVGGFLVFVEDWIGPLHVCLSWVLMAGAAGQITGPQLVSSCRRTRRGRGRTTRTVQACWSFGGRKASPARAWSTWRLAGRNWVSQSPVVFPNLSRHTSPSSLPFPFLPLNTRCSPPLHCSLREQRKEDIHFRR